MLIGVVKTNDQVSIRRDSLAIWQVWDVPEPEALINTSRNYKQKVFEPIESNRKPCTETDG